jgi:formylglycine-generating enzyme required for sulfatase activity
MKRILGIAVVLGVVGALTVGCSKEKDDVVNLGNNVVIDLGNNVKLDMVLIPAGKFLMGSKKNTVDPFSNIKVEQPDKDESPQHEVILTKQFYIGKYEVTQEQWFEIMGENPSQEKGRKLPFITHHFLESKEFIKKLNAKTNGGYRLPTESEWEYACRAGTTTAYSFGEKITPKYANYEESKIGKPVTVGSYKPNAFGLYDMHGNLWEQCADWYGVYPKGVVSDPKGIQRVEGGLFDVFPSRVVRGGSFSSNGSDIRSSNRYDDTSAERDWVESMLKSMRYFDVGFRLAKDK